MKSNFFLMAGLISFFAFVSGILVYHYYFKINSQLKLGAEKNKSKDLFTTDSFEDSEKGLLLVQVDGQVHRANSSAASELAYEHPNDLIGHDIFHLLGNSKDSFARLESANERLRLSNAELEKFAYIAAHDLQTPLRHMTSYTQLLISQVKDDLDDEALEWAEFIEAGGLRMKALIDGLLNFSKLSKSDHSSRKLISIHKLVEQIKSEIFENTNISSRIQISYDSLPEVVGDSLQIEQLFRNLIDNACKFSRPDCLNKVKITALKEDRHWHFTLSDQGKGFDLRFADQIFEIFHRLETDPSNKGTGLGLAIAKRIVELHGGKIWATSEVDRGSDFHFTLAHYS